jgi:hypothetical protein
LSVEDWLDPTRKTLAAILTSAAVQIAEAGLQVSGFQNIWVAYGAWIVSGGLITYAGFHIIQPWLRQYQFSGIVAGVTRGAVVTAGIAIPVAVSVGLDAMMAWVGSDARQNYAAMDSNGVPLQRGLDECGYQAQLATVSIRRDVDRSLAYFDLKRKCMRLRGF